LGSAARHLWQPLGVSAREVMEYGKTRREKRKRKRIGEERRRKKRV
jgi:hypothetical protein